jgi:hypothetical protein
LIARVDGVLVLITNVWWALIVRVDGVLLLIMNVWWALIVKVDDAVLALISLAASIRLFVLCGMLRG